MLVVSTVFLVIAWSLYYHFTKNNNYWKKRNVPGPEPTFFFGNTKDLFFRKKSISQICKDIYKQFPNEKIVGIFRMKTPDLLVKDLEIIKHILIKDFDLFMARDLEFSHKGLGANLFHADPSTWQMLRKRFTPAFTSGKLKNMMHHIIKCADKLMKYVDKIIVEQPGQEIHAIFKKFTQENIAACFYGLDLDCYSENATSLDALENKVFIMDHRADLEMTYPGILKKIGLSLMPREVIKFFYTLTKTIIDQRNGEPTDRNDFVDLLLTLRKEKHVSAPKFEEFNEERTMGITDDIIASQIFIFFFAGYQTSATTMSFMLYYLALNNDIQDKVVEEIEAVLKNHGGKLTYEAISQLTYMDQVISETLRLQPVTEGLRRVAATDYKVPGTDLTVEKGQIFLIPVAVIQMDPDNYPNPEKFDPDRFTPEKVRARHSCAYLPFGEGPRKCMGMRLAVIVIKICMAKLLTRVRAEPSVNTPTRFDYESSRLAVFPRGGFPLKLVHRN